MNDGIWRWAERLQAIPPEFRLTLGEGGTPLVRSRRIGPAAGLTNLFFKLESANPTGSYKDRFAAAAISHMQANGQTECIATSSGNTGAALAAACAVAGIDCRIAIVETAPDGKLKQMLAYGADISRVRGFGIDPKVTVGTFEQLRRMGQGPGRALQISAYTFSPEGMNGVETIAFELDEESETPIDHVFVPAGGGGLCLAIARGFEKYESSSPAVECVQPEGNDTMAGPLREGRDHGRKVEPCTTEISGLQVPNVLDAGMTIAACRNSGGNGHLVSDAEIFAVQKRLAREEGIFSEPAGAVALAGALKASAAGEIQPGATVVCLVTGSGFKDEASVDRMNAGVECGLVDEFEERLPAAT